MTDTIDRVLNKLAGLDRQVEVAVVEDDPPDLETLRAFARMGTEILFVPITTAELAKKLDVPINEFVLMVVDGTAWVIKDGHPLIEQVYDLYTDLTIPKETEDHGTANP